MDDAEDENYSSTEDALSPRPRKSARHHKHSDITRNKVAHVQVPSLPSLKPSSIVNSHWQPRAKERNVIGTTYELPCLRCPNFCILLIFVLLYLVSTVQCTAPQPLSSLSLNANGLSDFVQRDRYIQDAVQALDPHLISISETKSQHLVGNRLRLSNYNIFENPGVPTSNKKASKWGVILAIRKDIHAQLVTVIPRLRGRVCAADLHLPASNGLSVQHRVLSIYAPWDPGGDDIPLFWHDLGDICSAAPRGHWSMYGDYNATLSSCEYISMRPHRPLNTEAYSNFLLRCGGTDLWSQLTNRDASTHYTYKGPFGQTIIDRVACSSQSMLESHISVYRKFFGSTDHRALFARVFLSSDVTLTNSYRQPLNSFTPRFSYPRKGETQRFHTFSSNVAALLKGKPNLMTEINSEPEFDTVYHTYSEVLMSSAQFAFRKPSFYQPSTPPNRNISSFTIKQLLRETKRVNRLIYALKQPDAFTSFPLVVHKNPWSLPFIASFDPSLSYALRQHLPTPNLSLQFNNLLDYLKSVRSSLAKLRYREEKSLLRQKAVSSSRNLVNSVLLGGSAKRLFPSLNARPPLVLSLSNNPNTFLTDPATAGRG
ncbi:hypothetical protein E1B28_013162 [Marasmius oreades]|uniref:Endonuclease/exonuclease/phosphatase domain-containing protein n=1 Tax=Marasmius oreades TaxID=181124 RepID=A0A9P7ULR1_9AGAR|nr:uncharacterized protein E1B28_013162 [Marasmius oreades]KAG7087182.1 hypothetical protein E1B28_013162 [Marasmius oreades]